MKKRGKNKKGFTMIELMIVITVIGILAIVLLPRIGRMRDEARTSGVETNIRDVQAMIELEIGRHANSTAGAAALEGRLNSRLGDDVENPFSGKGSKIIESTADIDGKHAVYIHDVENASPSAITESGIKFDGKNELNDAEGAVIVLVDLEEAEANRLTAYIYGYDFEGRYIANSKRTIQR